MQALLGFFLFLNSFLAFSMDTMTVNVDVHSNPFVIKLPANPTTGYQWAVKQYDKTILKLSGSEYLAPQTKLVGAGGEMIFTFSRLKGVTYPKSMTMLFSYARSWEPNSGTIKKVKVNFSAK